ncbi:DUF3301 domain-containing protein [Ectothiorhodospiraceae bacterium WFHF3C12]|nr:DUF3301 domain-containing protein [Ectothiorhodospiraceae bacterium WFHF3C12]
MRDPATALLMIMAIALIVGAWYRLSGTREAATSAAARACSASGLQFLDGTVSFHGARLSLRRGQPLLLWRYRFEYSRDGEDRWPGEIYCLGRRAVRIQVEDEQGTTMLVH